MILRPRTVAHTKNGSREQNHAPFRGHLSSLLAKLDIVSLCRKFQSSSFSHS